MSDGDDQKPVQYNLAPFPPMSDETLLAIWQAEHDHRLSMGHDSGGAAIRILMLHAKLAKRARDAQN